MCVVVEDDQMMPSTVSKILTLFHRSGKNQCAYTVLTTPALPMTPPRGGTLEVDVEGEAKVARRDAVDEAVLPQQRGAFVRHAADLHTPAPQKQRQKL